VDLAFIYSESVDSLNLNSEKILREKISDHQQRWGFEDGPWMGPRPSLLVAADF
jgi:hypothetical protein